MNLVLLTKTSAYIKVTMTNRARRQSGFPTFISCQRQDANVLPKRRQSHQGDKLCDVSTVPLVARWPVFLARGSDADGEPHSCMTSNTNWHLVTILVVSLRNKGKVKGGHQRA